MGTWCQALVQGRCGQVRQINIGHGSIRIYIYTHTVSIILPMGMLHCSSTLVFVSVSLHVESMNNMEQPQIPQNKENNVVPDM